MTRVCNYPNQTKVIWPKSMSLIKKNGVNKIPVGDSFLVKGHAKHKLKDVYIACSCNSYI